MRATSKAMIILGLLIGSAFSAMADTKWTLVDIAFDNGNVANGWFLVNPALNAYDGFSLTVTGPASGAAFTATIAVDAYLPNTIGFADTGFSKFAVLYLSTPLTNAGGIVPIGLGYDCPGCGTLLLANSGHDPHLDGVTPEPSALLLFATGLAPVGFWLRRKLG
jgi:hypothetical protein